MHPPDVWALGRQQKRIHKEPGHEEDADTEEDDGEMRKDGGVDRADIASHQLYGRLLKQHAKHTRFPAFIEVKVSKLLYNTITCSKTIFWHFK